MREPPKKREVKALGGTVARREVRHIGPPIPVLETASNADVQVLDEKLKTEEQLRKDRELAIGNAHQADEGASDFWVAIVFQTRTQRIEWVKAMAERKLLPLDAMLDSFISGTALAAAQGIALPPGPKWRPEQPPKDRWAKLARPVPRPVRPIGE